MTTKTTHTPGAMRFWELTGLWEYPFTTTPREEHSRAARVRAAIAKAQGGVK